MTNLIAPQAKEIYSVILHNESPLSVSEISKILGYLAPAVHRSIKQLLSLRVVESLAGYPRRYQVANNPNTLNWFLATQKREFLSLFSIGHSRDSQSQQPKITFIRNRDDLLTATDKDVTKAHESVDFIVSGLEVPDATILAYRGALQRRVTIRAIVQKDHRTSSEKLEKWKNIGIEYRYANSTDIRVFIIDKKIVYITSYDDAIMNRATGVRFEYEPFALMMNTLFEQQWADSISLVL